MSASGEWQGRLKDRFDAVIFLTASDWKTEPRSNRYHYATRFAARLPVWFVQPDAPHARLWDEPSGYPNIRLLHCSWQDDSAAAQRSTFRPASAPPTAATALKAFFLDQGIRRPLLWIYNASYRAFILAQSDAFKAFHATEDYTLGPSTWPGFSEEAGARLDDVLADCDLLVAVSEAVKTNYVARTAFNGAAITLPNGCDFRFWFESGAYDYRPAGVAERLLERLAGRSGAAGRVLYQGGINDRLDYDLIDDLAGRMPDFMFDFCGPVDDSEASADEMAGWRRARRRPNVRYHGTLPPEGVARLARRAAVAITPFRDTPLIAVSLPLKVYEYLACGLPVVTIPIPALAHDPDNFTFARTVGEYEAAIRRLTPTRADPHAVARRLSAARLMDYDRRFEELEAAILPLAGPPPAACAPPATVDSPRPGPPADSRAVRAWGAQDVVCSAFWRDAGANLELDAEGARISTPPRAWDYAAALPLDLGEIDLATERAWLELTVRDVEGAPLVSVMEGDDSVLLHESPLVAGPAPVVYVLELDSTVGQRLLFRNGDLDVSSRLRFLGVRLLAWPRFAPL